MAGRYDVFLCHNQADKPAVEELENRLRAAGLEVWLDKSELRRGVHWTGEVEKCLAEECNCCAVIVGPSGLGPWQQQEVRLALDRQVEAGRKNGSFPVIPLLLPGGKPESLPPFLKGNTYVAFRKTLDDETFDEFVRAIQGLPPRRSHPTNEECCYRGLEFFDVANAPYFYGRDILINRLLEKLGSRGQNQAPSRFLAIVGASGSGKSSLARAGLVAALQRGAIEGSGEWPVVISRPGLDPCANLAIEMGKRGGLDLDKRAEFKDRLKDRMCQDAAALHESVQLILSSDDPRLRLVILIDQFEELFTICQDETLRTAFIDNLLHASHIPQGRTVVLLAMRADFYGKCASYPKLALAVPECQVLVGPMSESELQEAIEKPAQKVGCELEPGLVALLLKEVADQPGSLPYLQFALRELWNKRSGRRLTTDAYRTIGGVTGALQRKADEVYSRLSESQQLICRRIFLRLTQLGEGTEDTKRRISLNELRPTTGSMAEVEAVLFNLSEAETRLVTEEGVNGQEFVEVAHEALIRGWPQLRAWIDADRTALWTQRRLTEAANQWNDNHRDASFLYSGARLGTAEEWATLHAEEINPLETEFIKVSQWHVRWQKLRIAAAVSFVLLVGTLGWLYIRHQAVEETNRTHAAELVDQLLNADISEVPGIIVKLDHYRAWADPLLREEDGNIAPDPRKKLRLALALLPVDQRKITELNDQLCLVSATAFPVVRNALVPYNASIVEPLWTVALDANREAQQRFQAACALATYAPADHRWTKISDFVAGRLVALEAAALVAWREALRPAKDQLITGLASIFRDAKQKEQARTYATETLAEYAADRPEELFDLLADAEEFQFPALFRKLASHKDKAVALANEELAKQPAPTANENQKELLAKRQANAAVALLRLGTSERVWNILKDSPDPRARSYVIHWLSARGGQPQPILQRLEAERDVTIRQALLLMLGDFIETQVAFDQRQAWIDKLLAIYETEPNAGLHGAVECLLRKWGQQGRLKELLNQLKSDEKQLQAQKSQNKRQWYVNTEKQTFVILDAGEFVMGSPESEPDHQKDERQHRKKIGRRFAIAAHEVTKNEFDQFRQTLHDSGNKTTSDKLDADDSPQVAVTWYEAVRYCNWLSEQQGISKAQWCYEPNKQGMYAAGMKAKNKFWELTGYRLPTEAEWEYACRAGTVTSRYYGLTPKLLPQYAWYVEDGENHTWPVGKLEPNGWGLADMLGNAMEWCYDPPVPYPMQPQGAINDWPATRPVDDAVRRAVRGGAFNFLPRSVRSAYRNYFAPDTPIDYIGFRPARTYP